MIHTIDSLLGKLRENYCIRSKFNRDGLRHELAGENSWMDTGDRMKKADDNGLIEVATFVVRTLPSRGFIFLRIIGPRATLEATAAEKSSPLRCCDSSVGTERKRRRRRRPIIAGVVRPPTTSSWPRSYRIQGR